MSLWVIPVVLIVGVVLGWFFYKLLWKRFETSPVDHVPLEPPSGVEEKELKKIRSEADRVRTGADQINQRVQRLEQIAKVRRSHRNDPASEREE